MKSSPRKKPALTRAEIQAAYRRRQAQEKRNELRELVSLAYQLGRKSQRDDPIPPTKLLARIRELRDTTAAAKRSKKAAALLQLLTG